MENQRVGIGILPTGEQEKELQESLNPLAENFDSHLKKLNLV